MREETLKIYMNFSLHFIVLHFILKIFLYRTNYDVVCVFNLFKLDIRNITRKRHVFSWTMVTKTRDLTNCQNIKQIFLHLTGPQRF